MQVPILKKNRSLRIISSLSAMTIMIFSFQNCAPQGGCSGGSTSGCSTDSSSNTSGSGSSSKSPYQNNNNLVIGGGGSSGNSGGSGGKNGVIVIGGGGSGSGAGGGSSSGGSSSGNAGGGSGTIIVGGGNNSGGGGAAGDTSLRIVNQPKALTVYEKQDFSFEVGVTGGKYPYSYQWYKDGNAVTNGLGTYSFYMDNADNWGKEGAYSVTVKDATGASLTSQTVRVGIMEPTTGCAAGSYFTFTNASYDQAYGYFPSYFDGPRGKFLVHSSYDTANFLYQFSSYTGLKSWSFGALAHLAKAAISCEDYIPRINSPESCYDYGGSVVFECHNNKLKLISNTCQKAINHCSGGS